MAASLPSVCQTRLGLPEAFLHLPPRQAGRLPAEIPFLRAKGAGEGAEGAGRGEGGVAERLRVDNVGLVVSVTVICVIVGQLKSGLWVVFGSAVVLEGCLAAVALAAELALLRPRSTSTSRCIY